MKKSALLLTVAASACAVSTSVIPAPRQSGEEKETQWLAQKLKQIKKIKPGTTRKEVEKLFEADGGVQRLNPMIFVYRTSPYIKLQVNFKVAKNRRGYVVLSPNDKVISVSKPYLEEPNIG